MARLNTADPNKVHHVFGQTKHNWHKTGLDQTGNVRLIEQVGNNQRALVQSQQVRGGTVHTYQQTVNGNQVVVKVYENQQGVRSVSDAWVR